MKAGVMLYTWCAALVFAVWCTGLPVVEGRGGGRFHQGLIECCIHTRPVL